MDVFPYFINSKRRIPPLPLDIIGLIANQDPQAYNRLVRTCRTYRTFLRHRSWPRIIRAPIRLNEVRRHLPLFLRNYDIFIFGFRFDKPSFGFVKFEYINISDEINLYIFFHDLININDQKGRQFMARCPNAEPYLSSLFNTGYDRSDPRFTFYLLQKRVDLYFNSSMMEELSFVPYRETIQTLTRYGYESNRPLNKFIESITRIINRYYFVRSPNPLNDQILKVILTTFEEKVKTQIRSLIQIKL